MANHEGAESSGSMPVKRRGAIHEFDPVIYPCRLWVAVNPDKKDISGKFYGLTEEMDKVALDETDLDTRSFVIAKTSIVSDVESGWIGAFVWILKPKQMDVKTICHESSHVADFICEQFGIQSGSFDSGEAKAYLVGWVADCIYKVKTSRSTSNNAKPQ